MCFKGRNALGERDVSKKSKFFTRQEHVLMLRKAS
jgi:hypothetical protein